MQNPVVEALHGEVCNLLFGKKEDKKPSVVRIIPLKDSPGAIGAIDAFD